MYFECEDTVELKKQKQKIYTKAYQIHNDLLYHYATSETLWKILESDCFLARNIRFSNDSKEYKTGQASIEKFIREHKELSKKEKEKILMGIRNNPMMYYMICFCQNGDLLSQWRGYAKHGVSIGMDFNNEIKDVGMLREHIEFFSILNNSKQKEEMKAEGEKKKYYINNESLIFLQMPYKVQYINQKKKSTPKDLQEILNEIWDKGREEERVSRLLHYIPFIKDKGFKEEAECRLIFDMEFLGESKAHSNRVRSKKIDYINADNLKKPYIAVEVGDAKQKLSDVKKVVLGVNAKKMEYLLKGNEPYKELKLITDDSKKGIYIGEGKNQELILEWLEKYIEFWKENQKQKDKIKIWCEGHLPIRKIIVGPSEDQEDMKESIEYYVSTVFWLRYIDVELSEIPLKS